MKVPEFNQKFGHAGEDLIGSTIRRDQLYGFGGNDRRYAMGGDDQLYGGAGNDLLDGGNGAPTSCMGKPAGHPHWVDNLADLVSETTVPGVDDGGIDTVESLITYSLGAFVEKLNLEGDGGDQRDRQ